MADSVPPFVGFAGRGNQLIYICTTCAGHIPTDSYLGHRDDSSVFLECARHVCLSEPSAEGLAMLEELGHIDAVAHILGVPHS